MIQSNPEWNYCGVYADEDYNDTKETRPEFQRMLADCRAGKINLILVKSISRFSRNTVILLNIVRELKLLSCTTPNLSEAQIETAFIFMLNGMLENRNEILAFYDELIR